MTEFNLHPDGSSGLTGSRHFEAPPQAVFDAHHDPDLVRQWMLGPPGWVITDCRIDPRPGGQMRVTWADEGGSFTLVGTFKALYPPHRVEHVEHFLMPDPTPETRVITQFEASGRGTDLRITMTAADQDSRDAMLASGMGAGMAASYDRLDTLLSSG